MHRIASIEIGGFRGVSKTIVMPMDPDVNFFIGRNGSGKTRLMNLLNHALAAEIRPLLQSEFKFVQFRLQQSRSRHRPTIKITRSHDDEGEVQITYEISASAKGKPQKFIVGAGDLHQAMWAPRYRTVFDSRGHYLHDPGEIAAPKIRAAIQELIEFSWISVHRGALEPQSENERRYESLVDRKLHQVARDFGTYFSTLDKQAAEETDKFQKIYLLSLISPSGFGELAKIGSVNAEDEKNAIRGMFAEFNIKSSAYSAKLDTFAKRMTKALENRRQGGPMGADDFLVLTDTVRIHDAVKEWHQLLEKRSQIYAPKEDFVSILNDMYYKKTVSINSGNQPVFKNEEGIELTLDNLSSGEKQLFILLGETLLQRRQNCIFMADEPEISLHIDWQERLVPSLRRINPNAQIIFATHSPDVVGAYAENAIDLESVA